MKKTFKFMLAMFMALTMAMGTASTAYAAKPVDYGLRGLEAYQFTDQDGRVWDLYSVDYKVFTEYGPNVDDPNKTEVTLTIGEEITGDLSREDFSPTINWKRGAAGIATFKNSLMNLTITGTEPSGITKTIENRYYKTIIYIGPALVKGTITLMGAPYDINCTVSNFAYGEVIDIIR